MNQVDKTAVIQKFAGKGGWTYVEIPEIPQNPAYPFGWEIVSGHIDGIELKKVKLMPMGNGHLFLPVKAELRKRLNKDVGDAVHVVLSRDKSRTEIPEDILQCFYQEKASLLERFLRMSPSHQKAYLDWISEAKKDETRVRRIAKMLQEMEAD